MDIRSSELFSSEHSLLGGHIAELERPWEILGSLPDMIRKIGETLDPDEFERRDGDIWISHSATVAESASITGPCIICAGAEIRHCAFIRGSVIVGEKAVVGNSSELKNSVLYDAVQVPHFNYIGDSILGYHAHFGAGSITSNVKGDKTEVVIKNGGESIATGRKKLGALVGDNAEIGCNAVLNPGTVIGRDARIYPLSSVRGTVGEGMIYKSYGNIVAKK